MKGERLHSGGSGITLVNFYSWLFTTTDSESKLIVTTDLFGGVLE